MTHPGLLPIRNFFVLLLSSLRNIYYFSKQILQISDFSRLKRRNSNTKETEMQRKEGMQTMRNTVRPSLQKTSRQHPNAKQQPMYRTVPAATGVPYPPVQHPIAQYKYNTV